MNMNMLTVLLLGYNSEPWVGKHISSTTTGPINLEFGSEIFQHVVKNLSSKFQLKGSGSCGGDAFPVFGAQKVSTLFPMIHRQ
jgi:hypothetical protein